MATLQEQFSAFNEKAFNSVLDFTALSLENTERLLDLQVESAKGSLEESADHVKALVAAKDAQELLALRTKLVEASVERATSYARTVYELAVEAQSKVSQLVEAQMAAFNEGLITAVEAAAKSAPAGADVAIAAVKSSVAATTAAVDTLNRTAKEAAKLTDGAVKAAQQATATAVKSGKGRKAA